MKTVVEERGDQIPTEDRPEPSFSGPMWLASVAAWLVAVAGWTKFITRPIPDSIAVQLTRLGKVHYRPDYDLPVYLGGLIGSVGLGLVCVLLWRRQWRLARADEKASVQRLLKWHGWLAIGCVLLGAVQPAVPSFE